MTSPSRRVGEKFIHWTDNTPSKSHMLTWLTLYWLTKSYPTSIFYYRDVSQRLDITVSPGSDPTDLTKELKGMYVDKPIGYSKFPKELLVTPESWARKTGNMVFFNEHRVGESRNSPHCSDLFVGYRG